MAVLMTHPIMIVRARLDPTVLQEFEDWHRQTHLPHVLEIPGIVSAFRVRGSDPIAGAHLMGYTFEDESVVQGALSSEEAQVARRDWDHWTELRGTVSTDAEVQEWMQDMRELRSDWVQKLLTPVAWNPLRG